MQFLVIDGGGTSTKVYLTNEQKEILRQEVFADLNPQIKEKHSLEVLFNITTRFKNQFDSVYLGMPGIDQYPLKDKIYKVFLQSGIKRKEQIHLMTDIEIHEFLHCSGEKYLVIAIGSGTVGIEKNGNEKRILSSFGPFFSDEGSAFTFARLFIREAIRENERKHYQSWYIKTVLNFFSFQSLEDVKTMYNDWNRVRDLFLSFTKYVLTTVKDHQTEIDKICLMNAELFNEWFNGILLNKDIKRIYLFGGMFKNKTFLLAVIKNLEENYEIVNAKDLLDGQKV